MSSAGLEVLDTTLQKTHEWLNEIMAALGRPPNPAGGVQAAPCRCAGGLTSCAPST
jgi:hypothetical protein